MRKPWITALAWLLIAAVPVQGFAAALMVNCGPQHHGAAQPSVRATEVQGQHQHAHAARDAHHAHEHAWAADTAQAHAPQDADAEPAAKATCSACAACCIGIALTSSTALPPVIAPSSPPRLEATDPAVDIVASGPERPPRLLLV